MWVDANELLVVDLLIDIGTLIALLVLIADRLTRLFIDWQDARSLQRGIRRIPGRNPDAK